MERFQVIPAIERSLLINNNLCINGAANRRPYIVHYSILEQRFSLDAANSHTGFVIVDIDDHNQSGKTYSGLHIYNR